MNPQRTEPKEFWKLVESAPDDTLIVYGFCPKEFVSESTDPNVNFAKIESDVVKIPNLQVYSRIGLYSCVGITPASMDVVIRWLKSQYSQAKCFAGLRIGLSVMQSEGLNTVRLLELGANEESLVQPRSRIFFLNSITHRVEPASVE